MALKCEGIYMDKLVDISAKLLTCYILNSEKRKIAGKNISIGGFSYVNKNTEIADNGGRKCKSI